MENVINGAAEVDNLVTILLFFKYIFSLF